MDQVKDIKSHLKMQVSVRGRWWLLWCLQWRFLRCTTLLREPDTGLERWKLLPKFGKTLLCIFVVCLLISWVKHYSQCDCRTIPGWLVNTQYLSWLFSDAVRPKSDTSLTGHQSFMTCEHCTTGQSDGTCFSINGVLPSEMIWDMILKRRHLKWVN